MRPLKKTLCVFLIIPLLFAHGPSAIAAPDAQMAMNFIRDGVMRTLRLYNDKRLTRRKVADHVRRELNNNFDINTIAAYALGPLRRSLTDDQKARYLSEFSEWAVQTVTGLALSLRGKNKLITSNTVLVTGTRPLRADQILVYSKIRPGGTDSLKVDWRLRTKEQRFLVLDIIILGVSQLYVFKSQFAAIMRRHGDGVEGLIAILKQKNNHMRLVKD